MSNFNDSEVKYLVALLGKPSLQYNDGWYEWLGTKGQTGAYNDRWYNYLGTKGATGALNDRFKQAFCGGLFSIAPLVWILSSSDWVDNNNWVDDEFWID